MTEHDTTAYPSLDELRETLPETFYGIARQLRNASESTKVGSASRTSNLMYLDPPYKDQVWTMVHVRGDKHVTIINSLQYCDGRGFHDREWIIPVDLFDKLFPKKGDDAPPRTNLPMPTVEDVMGVQPMTGPTGKVFKLVNEAEVNALRQEVERLTARLDNATRVNNANDAAIARQASLIDGLEKRIENLQDERVWLQEQLARYEGDDL